MTQLKFSRDGNLIIAILNNNASTAESILWSTAHFVVNRSTAETSTNTTSAILRNNGNLALVAHSNPSSDSSEAPLWQSFDHPTDVGIPGAKLGWNKVTGVKWQYISKKNLIDPGLGSYSLETGSNRILRLGRIKPPSRSNLVLAIRKISYTFTCAQWPARIGSTDQRLV